MSTACCNQEDWVTRPQNGVSIVVSKLTACRFGNFIKDASKVGGNLAVFVFLVAAFGLALPAGGVACQPQTPPTPQNQSGMEKQRTFHTPIGDAPSQKTPPDPTRSPTVCVDANRPHFQFIKWHLFGALGSMDVSTIYLYLPRYICAYGPKASIFNFISVARPQSPTLVFHYLFFQFAFAGFVFWLQHSAFSGSWFAHLNFKWLLIFSRICSFLFSVSSFFSRFIGWVVLIVGLFCGILNKLLVRLLACQLVYK